MTSLPITPTNPDHSICQRIQIWIHYESESRFGKSNTALEQLWQTPPPACVGDPAFSEDRPLLTLCLLARSQRPVCVKTRQTGPVGKGGLTQTWMVWLVIPPPQVPVAYSTFIYPCLPMPLPFYHMYLRHWWRSNAWNAAEPWLVLQTRRLLDTQLVFEEIP